MADAFVADAVVVDIDDDGTVHLDMAPDDITENLEAVYYEVLGAEPRDIDRQFWATSAWEARREIERLRAEIGRLRQHDDTDEQSS